MTEQYAKYIKLIAKDINGTSLPFVVDDLSFNSNSINTARLIYFKNEDESITLPAVGNTIKIYATGEWYGEPFLKNKTITEIYDYLQNQPETQEYNFLLFIGRVKQIRAEAFLQPEMKQKIEIELVGVEEELQLTGFNSYLFYDPEYNQIIEVAGFPNFAGYNRHEQQNLFVKDGLGIKWTCYDIVSYLSQNYGFRFAFDTITQQTLQNTPFIASTQFYNFEQLLNLICGGLFTWCVKYSEAGGDHYYIKIQFNYNSTTATTLSILLAMNVELASIELPQKLVLAYPFIIDFTVNPLNTYVYRHPSNATNEGAYDLTQAEYNEAKAPVPFVYSYFFISLFQLPIPHPEKYDYYLKNSLGAKLGVHSKFILQPIFEYNNTMFNLDDFEWVVVNDVFLKKNNVPFYFRSNRPYKKFTIELNGSELNIDCDIPHQFAPSSYSYPYSMIETPVFPIDNGDGIVISGILKSKNVKRIKYRGVVNGRAFTYHCNSVIDDDTADAILDNLYYLISLIDRKKISYRFPIYEYFIELLDLNCEPISKLWQLNKQRQDVSIDVNSVVSSVHISREGAGYWCTIETDFEPNIEHLINVLLFNKTFEAEKTTNQISFDGNEGEFYGTIQTIEYNHYTVNCGFQEGLEVARIDNMKLGYWMWNRPSEDYYFKPIEKQGQPGIYEPSIRKSILKKDGIEEEKQNKIVPAEIEFPQIKFRWGVGNILVLLGDNIQGFRIVKFVDTNEDGRSWAEIVG